MIDRTNAYEQAFLAYDAEPSKPCEAILTACNAFLAALLADPATREACLYALNGHWPMPIGEIVDRLLAVLRVLGTDTP